jgi:hypothetical protein
VRSSPIAFCFVLFFFFFPADDPLDGHCLRNPVEQQGSLSFLCRAEKVLGWRTAWIRQELARQWTEMAVET